MALRYLCKLMERGCGTNTAREGTGTWLHLPEGYNNRGADSTDSARAHSFGATCCVDACLKASLVSQSLNSPRCVVHKIILNCHLNTSYRISSGSH